MTEARITLAVFLIVILYAMFGGMGMKCQQADPLPEGVRHVRIVESLQTGVRIQADDEGLIVRDIPCFDGDPERRCIWISCLSPTPEDATARKEAAAAEMVDSEEAVASEEVIE